jgi:murein DD-endopeptidase MepM/ murein hydrolase activator NlpD
LSLTVAASVGVGSLLGGTALKTEAESISSLKQKQSDIQSQQDGLNSSINKTDQKIDSLKGQQVDVQSELKRIGSAIDNTNKGIQEKTTKIQNTKVQISKLQDEIKVIQDRIQKRNELLKDRARNYQENGSVNYVSVLMGAQSIGDLIDLAGAVATIMEADKAILQQAESDKQELEQKQTKVQSDLDSLQKMVRDLESLNNQLNSQKTQQATLLGSLQQQEKEATDNKMDMQEQAQILAAQSSAIQKAIQNEQARQAAEASQKTASAPKAAEAPKASTSSSGGGGTTAAAPPVSSSSFTRPASGAVTSGYGGRIDPFTGESTFHYGVDIANSGPNVPIVAAADGVVVTAHVSSSYGNVVYISHSINGHIYTTVYAHMSRYIVSEGQTVTKGQQIGFMGSSGEATGQHLHFELYNGPWAYHSAINPTGIVPF